MVHIHKKTLKRSLLLLGGLFLLSSDPILAKTETNLSKALKSGDKSIEFSGKEKESVKIPKGVRVVGSAPDKAIISNDIVMANGSSLENITVDGKIIAITIEKGASVTLTNVTVSGGSDTGIFAPKGGASLTIKNSRIRQNRKGIFLLEGNRISLSGVTVSNNKEEGLDMHAGTQGSITGSTFSGNSEGGIEVIINGGGLSLTNNIFSGNQASGLALQSYGGGGGGSKTGSFSLSGNSFVNNGNFGIDCKNPQGTGGAFFGSSVKANGNTLSGNKKGAINPECGIANRAVAVGDVKDSDNNQEKEKEDTVEDENTEEAATTANALEITESIERNDESAPSKLLEESVVLKEESRLYKEQLRKKPWFTPQEKVKKGQLTQKQAKLKEEISRCRVVASREVSLDLSSSETSCTKEEKTAAVRNLSEATEHLEYTFFRDAKKYLIEQHNQFEDFFLREVWKF
jgi:parallel beta-helix repeat protein